MASLTACGLLTGHGQPQSLAKYGVVCPAAGRLSEITVKLFAMNECRYCRKMRDEWDCHGQECRTAIARALRRQRLGLPMVPNLIRNEIPAGATTGEVITVLWRQRVRARRANEERRNRKAADDFDAD